MSTPRRLVAIVAIGIVTQTALIANSQEQTPRLGTPVSEEQLANFDLIAAPDGSGFPSGSGTAMQGRTVFNARCAACHTATGEGVNAATRLVGGDIRSQGTPVKTVGSYWPYASTVFDFIRRAMPADAPKSLSNEEAYQVTAYVLYLNGIIEEDTVLNGDTLAEVEMPNAAGFVDRSTVHE